jgi:hypothetical protein
MSIEVSLLMLRNASVIKAKSQQQFSRFVHQKQSLTSFFPFNTENIPNIEITLENRVSCLV